LIPFLTQKDVISDISEIVNGNFSAQNWFINGIIFLAFITGIFIGGANNISATSISRDGQNFFMTKIIPIPLKKQLFAKGVVGYLFGLIPFLMVIIGTGIGFKLELSLIIGTLILGMIGIVLINAWHLFTASIKPNLQWTNEVEVVKRGTSIYLGFLSTLALMGIASIYLILLSIAPAIFISGLIILGVSFTILGWMLAIKSYNKFANNY
jgi:ABC-2 type transport system permease protein